MSNGAETNPLVALREIATKNIADKLAERLCEMILQGKLPSGYAFPSENVLCEELQVGRSTIREAYNVLKTRGLITRTKRGTFVNNEEVLLANMSFEDVIEHASWDDYFEFNTILVVQVAALAVERATHEDIHLLFECVEKLRKIDKFTEEFLSMISSFYLQLASAAHNSIFIKAMDIMTEAMTRKVSHLDNIQTNTIQHIVDSHEIVAVAIKQENAEQVRDKMYDAITELNDFFDIG
jgi:GntR family transcriptional repressor for pyruvate dehydrogenase complex